MRRIFLNFYWILIFTSAHLNQFICRGIFLSLLRSIRYDYREKVTGAKLRCFWYDKHLDTHSTRPLQIKLRFMYIIKGFLIEFTFQTNDLESDKLLAL